MSASPGGAGPLILMRRILWAAILVAFLAALTFWGFDRWMPRVWFGDDLSNYLSFRHGIFASNPIQSLTQLSAEKFRPVFALILEGVFTGFGVNLRHYLYLNVLLNAVNGGLLALSAFRLSRSRLVAVLAATVMVLSRFMLYQVTQVTGLLEGSGFLLLLIVLWAVVDLHTRDGDDDKGVLRSALVAVVAAWLLVFDHERYLPAIPWLAVMLWIAPAARRLSSDVRQGLAAAVLAAVAVNIGYKKYVLKAAVMVGTGGTHITIDVVGMVERVKQAILSVFGINDGPAYLVGHAVTGRLFTAIGFSAMIFIAVLVALAVLAVRNLSAVRPAPRPWPYRLPASFAVLAGLLLIPPALTIRMEQRWLVEPFALVLLSAAWCAGRIAARRQALALFGVLAAASIVVDVRLSAAFPQIYMVSSAREGLNIKRTIIDPGAPNRVEIIGSDDVCNWVLLRGGFFELYAPKTQAECVNSADQLPPLLYRAADRPRVFVFQPDLTFKDDSRHIYTILARRDEPIVYDFLRMFPSGRINDDRHVETPTGKGVLMMPLQTSAGEEPALVVLSGFAYRYERLDLGPQDRLEFDLAMVYPTRTRARARILIQPAKGAADVVYEAMLPRREAGQPLTAAELSLPLGRFSGPVTVSFAVDSPEGDPRGHWVAFAEPRIARGGPAP